MDRLEWLMKKMVKKMEVSFELWRQLKDINESCVPNVIGGSLLVNVCDICHPTIRLLEF